MDEPVNNTSPNDSEVHLLDYLIIIAKHSRMIVIVSVAVTIFYYLYLLCMPNSYLAIARMLPPQQNLTLSAQLLDSMGQRVSPGGTSTAGGGMGALTASLLGLKSPGDLYIALMESNTLLDHIITQFNLMKLLKIKNLEDARIALKKRVKISAGKRDPVIVIEVAGGNPKLAAEMANAFIKGLDWLLQGLAVQEAKGRSAFLEKERSQASQNLTKAEESMRLFSEQNNILQIEGQTKGAIQYIEKLRAEIDAKEVGIQVLRQQATPFNYDLIRMETEVKGLKEKLRAAEAQTENCVSDVCLPTSKAATLGLDYIRLYREVKFQEGLFQLFNKMVEIARIDMVRDVTIVQVLDPAIPPQSRVNKRMLPSILSGLVTCVIMILVAFGLEYMQNYDFADRRFLLLNNYLRSWIDILFKMKNIIRSNKNI